MSGQEIEIKLNTSLELVEPKSTNLSDLIDNAKNIVVSVLDPDPISGLIFLDILKIINYGDHIKVEEKYRSPLGEIIIERILHNIKPSVFLRLIFPSTFK